MAEATLSRSIKDLIPKLAASLAEREYSESARFVGFWMDDVYLGVYEDRVLVHRVAELAPAEAAMRRLDEMLTGLERQPEGNDGKGQG